MGRLGCLAAAVLALTLLCACGPRSARANLANGHKIATVMGCTSCHGAALDGHLFQEDPRFALAWSSNLSRILPGWSDAQVESTLRTGRRPDGSALWFMPTFAQGQLSAGDMRDLVAWMRTVPPSGEPHPPIRRGPGFAQAMSRGFQDSAAEAIRLRPRTPVDLGPATARGRYLASIACAECHGPDLKGSKDPQPGDPPDLAVAAAYTPAAFATLLHTGVKADGRPAGDMAEEARKRLSALDKADVAALRAYLLARAARQR